MRQACPHEVLALLLLVLVGSPGAAQDKPAKRAKLPQFDSTTQRVFFPNLFDRLVGERPANVNAPATSENGLAASSAAAVSTSGGHAWSKLISPTTLEDEVKSIKIATDTNLTTPTAFAGRGYKEIRRDYSLLAMMFAIIAEYDGDVRWKAQAPAAREAFARTAANAKAGGNINVYNEAKNRKDDLTDLLNGASLASSAEQEETDWSRTADRSPLMQRLQLAGEKNLNAWTANKDSFSEHVEEVLHEAEIVAAIAEVLTREGMEDGEDEDYAAFANLMKASAVSIVEAVKLNDSESARKSVGEIAKACSDCHDSYR